MEVERWVRVRWETDRRYYEVHLHQDLWGTWVLTRTWGGRRSAQGNTVHQPCADQAEGQAQLAALIRPGAGTAIGGFCNTPRARPASQNPPITSNPPPLVR